MDYLQYTIDSETIERYTEFVLNLIINGLPSILVYGGSSVTEYLKGFKPYYKWITFNTKFQEVKSMKINFSFKPYYKWITFNTSKTSNVFYIRFIVLNLIINGLPSIPHYSFICPPVCFNVLNLIINGLPSIPLTKGMNVVFMLERSLFYMVAKFEHFSVIHGLLTFYIKFLLQFFYFF